MNQQEHIAWLSQQLEHWRKRALVAESEPLTPERIRSAFETDDRWHAARRRWAEIHGISFDDVPVNFIPAICVVLEADGYRWNGVDWVRDDD